MTIALTEHIWPVDEMTTPTVYVAVYADGEVIVIGDQDPSPADWQTMCTYLAGLGFGPYALSDACEEYAGEHDLWSLRLPAAA